MDLEVRHLRMIVAVAEHGSVTKAAATLGLAQPALTAQLNRIDRTLGGHVFTRDQRGARPTALGELVLDRARMLLPAMTCLVDDARRLANEPTTTGALRVGIVSTALGGLFLHRLGTALGDVQVATATSWSAEQTADQVATGALDAALVGLCGDAAPPTAPGVVWTPVAVDPVFVLLPATHPCADRVSVGLEDLADAAWLSAPGDGCFERCFVAACARAGFTPRSLSEVERAACVDLVQAGSAVALAQPTFPETAGVRVVALEGEPLAWSQFLAWHEDASDRVPVGALLDAAAGAHRDAVSRSPRYLYWLDARTGRPGHSVRV